jgi:hypothetical protein
MAKVKIVDDFNGYEGPTFDTEEEAMRELDRRRRAFFAQPGNAHARFCQTYVPENYTWYWDQQQNTWIWGK